MEPDTRRSELGATWGQLAGFLSAGDVSLSGMSLPVRSHMTLHLAAARYAHPGRRDADVRELLGWTPTTFWAHVDRLLDDPAALAAYPQDVSRLRRLRERRRWARRAS